MAGDTTKSDVEKTAHTNQFPKTELDKKPIIGVRWILAILAFFSYFIHFFVRNSFSVALVAMINATSASATDSDYTRDSCKPFNASESSEETKANEGEFNWNASEQGVILGGFFWGFVLSKLFVSRIGEVAGQRLTVAVGTCGAGILTLLCPVAASLHPYALAVDRFLVGACYGPIPATLHSLLSAWAPRTELATMIASVFAGMTAGGTVGLVLSGWLCDSYGWHSTFWIGGGLNFIFLPFWIIVVRNSPKEHPWLSAYEAKLLEGNRNVSVKKTVPWAKILLSPYLHICVLAQLSRTWLDAVVATEGPAFFTYKLGLKLSTGSYVCAANYLLSIPFLVFYGKISDYIVNKKIVSKVNARKICHLLANGCSVIFLIGICLADCNSVAVIVLWILIGGFASGTSCSYNVSVIDLAPNFTGTFMGIMAIGNLGSAITPLVTSAFLKQDNGWNKTFYLAAGWSLLSCLLYIPFMTAEPQSWNFDEEDKKKMELETKEK